MYSQVHVVWVVFKSVRYMNSGERELPERNDLKEQAIVFAAVGERLGERKRGTECEAQKLHWRKG